jgi:hypothetical protein
MTTQPEPQIIDAEPEVIELETQATDDPRSEERETDPEIEQIVEDFIDVGKMWAHHGVTIGKMAMKSSARTFEVTASALDTLARRFAPREKRDKTPRA